MYSFFLIRTDSVPLPINNDYRRFASVKHECWRKRNAESFFSSLSHSQGVHDTVNDVRMTKLLERDCDQLFFPWPHAGWYLFVGWLQRQRVKIISHTIPKLQENIPGGTSRISPAEMQHVNQNVSSASFELVSLFESLFLFLVPSSQWTCSRTQNQSCPECGSRSRWSEYKIIVLCIAQTRTGKFAELQSILCPFRCDWRPKPSLVTYWEL